MLSRVAAHLYWMSRYLERAENMARILDVGQSLALLAGPADASELAAEPLVITDTLTAFQASERALNPEQVARFLAWDKTHPSSILNCLDATRENARAVRGAITSEMWENINDTWLQLHQRRTSHAEPADAAYFEWVKERSHMFRGITQATLRHDQSYLFIRLGTFLERADNTARILSVKQGAGEGAEVTPDDLMSYYRLSAVLRSVSAFEAYRDTYRDAIDARRVVELLVFDARLPRSLRFCLDQVERVLQALPEQAGRPARRQAAVLRARLAFGELEDAFEPGLADFLERFLADNANLCNAVHGAYLELNLQA
jgi:uncharacterized alpha-E superfamily protein